MTKCIRQGTLSTAIMPSKAGLKAHPGSSNLQPSSASYQAALVDARSMQSHSRQQVQACHSVPLILVIFRYSQYQMSRLQAICTARSERPLKVVVSLQEGALQSCSRKMSGLHERRMGVRSFECVPLLPSQESPPVRTCRSSPKQMPFRHEHSIITRLLRHAIRACGPEYLP